MPGYTLQHSKLNCGKIKPKSSILLSGPIKEGQVTAPGHLELGDLPVLMRTAGNLLTSLCQTLG